MSLSKVFNCLFYDRKNYKNLSKEEKESSYFIISRNLSKRYPNLVMKFNNKEMDKSICLDLIYFEIGKTIIVDKYFKAWFWKNYSPKNKKVTNLNNKEINLLVKSLGIDEEDVLFLEKFRSEELIEELKYLKKVN